MISLSVLFWIFVLMFALIGAMRGWAKELLVTSGVLVALFLLAVMETFIPFFRESISVITLYWIRTSLVVAMAFFGYQTPNFPRIMESGKFLRERFQDILLGLFLGGINGYMIFGSLWFYLIDAEYPFKWISAPTDLSENVMSLIKILPPQYLQPPVVYVAVAIAFVFILVVFI
jgi:uncharacterized membrane protein required for colicin V production